MLDKLLTEVTSIDDLKALYIETFLNHTSKISKVSDLSVLNAHAFAVAKILQKDLKDAAILEARRFPELASGSYLDDAAKFVGGLSRLSATGSSTFVLVNADPGTMYIPGDSYFTSNQGINFDITEVVLIDVNGYAYIPVRSATVGVNTKVDAFTINSIFNPPIGHINCTNEFEAIGGADSETDEVFKSRLLVFEQFQAKSVKSTILANLQLYNSNIIDIIRSGFSEDGKLNFMLVTCNGQWFTQTELDLFEKDLSDFMSIADVNIIGENIGVQLINTTWFQVGGSDGVDFRVELSPGASEVTVRKDIQIQMTKYFDFRTWDRNKVEWDDLLTIVKSIRGVKYVPDEYFKPNVDQAIGKFELPRVIKFIMRDMSGNILYNNNSKVLPVYYQ